MAHRMIPSSLVVALALVLGACTPGGGGSGNGGTAGKACNNNNDCGSGYAACPRCLRR